MSPILRKIDYIEINGYKSIKSERIDLKKINVLIGANGSGKSNLLSFFYLLKRLYEKNLNLHVALNGGVEKILHNGPKVTKEISFKLKFGKGINDYSATIMRAGNRVLFKNEQLIDNDTIKEIGSLHMESNLKITDISGARIIGDYLEGLRVYHFNDTTDNSAFMKLSHIEKDVFFLYNDGSNLATFLYNIRKNDSKTYNLIVNIIKSVVPYFCDFYLVPNQEGYLYLNWKDKFSDSIYGPTDLSDGTLRFIALTTLFMQPKLPDSIVIDVPELGLHPVAVTKLASMIKSVSDRGCQVIVATQSADLISHFSPENIIVVDLIQGESRFERLSTKDYEVWLADYTIDDLWKRNIINKGQPNFV